MHMYRLIYVLDCSWRACCPTGRSIFLMKDDLLVYYSITCVVGLTIPFNSTNYDRTGMNRRLCPAYLMPFCYVCLLYAI